MWSQDFVSSQTYQAIARSRAALQDVFGGDPLAKPSTSDPDNEESIRAVLRGVTAAALASTKLVKNATLKAYPGAPHGLTDIHKEQFDEGSGVVDLLPQLIGEATAGIIVPSYQARHATDRLRSAEECWYHQLLIDAFDDAGPVLANVGRWALD